MDIRFDPVKSERNERERGLPFSLVEQLDWSGAVVEEDDRKDYGERRYRVPGFIGDRLPMPWCLRPAPARCMSSACERQTNER